MDGTLTVENGGIYDFLDLITRNLGSVRELPLGRLRKTLGRLGRRLLQYNPLSKASRNVRHHYDLSGALYDLFLDRDRQYSCAYFADPEMTLDEAQEAKKQHLAAKLLLKDGQKVLDIGSGWGGMGLYLARAGAVDVTGVTLSNEQHAISQQRAAAAGLADQKSASTCRITGNSPGRSTGSSRSACSNTSACPITRSISARSPTC